LHASLALGQTITFDLDIVFLIDATGSMQPCIDDLKQNIVKNMGTDDLAG
jgi:hypothetical protein